MKVLVKLINKFEEETLFCGEGTNLRIAAKKISAISGKNNCKAQ
jgi:hypothetical protein